MSVTLGCTCHIDEKPKMQRSVKYRCIVSLVGDQRLVSDDAIILGRCTGTWEVRFKSRLFSKYLLQNYSKIPIQSFQITE